MAKQLVLSATDSGVVVMEEGRRSSERYEILNEISRGTYGVVYRARDKRTEETVAMKEEVRGMCATTKAEIDILRSLQRHPCIVEFKRVVEGRGGERVFVVMEYMEYDLKGLTEKRMGRKQPFQVMEIKYLMEEILSGVSFLHSRGVMHRDLKPSNILFSTKAAEVKLCDFGFSVRFGSSKTASFSPQVGTLWYKSPQLLLARRRYSCEVDMWAVGCIMAELVLGKPLFRGTSEADQLYCINRVINPPFSLLRKKMAAAASDSGAVPLTPAGIDLLQRLLAYEPENRITAADALNHAWFFEQS